MPVEKTRSSRIIWVDIFKGIMIILVVFGHSGSPLTGWIYAFHMPAFLFISGYTTRIGGRSFATFASIRTASLMIPFFTVNAGFLALRLVTQMLGVESLFYPERLNLPDSLIGLVGWLAAPDLGGASWFLPVLLFSSLILFVIVTFIKLNQLPEGFIAFLVVLVGAVGYFMTQRAILQRMMIDLSIMAVLYVGAGYIAAIAGLLDRINHRYMVPMAIAVIWFSVRSGYSFMNWPTRDFKHIAWIIPTSLCGIYLMAALSMLLSRSAFLSRILGFIGKRTLPILMFHFLGFRLFFLGMNLLGQADAKLLQSLVPPSNNAYWILISIVSIAFSIGLSLLADKTRLLSLCVNGKNKWVGANK